MLVVSGGVALLLERLKVPAGLFIGAIFVSAAFYIGGVAALPLLVLLAFTLPESVRFLIVSGAAPARIAAIRFCATHVDGPWSLPVLIIARNWQLLMA